MAYDEALADRIRAALGPEPGVEEKKMFGGIAFLVGGNMAVAASGQGGMLVRVDPEEADRLVDGSGVDHMVMRGRSMSGWLRLRPEVVGTTRQVRRWVTLGVRVAGSPPLKTATRSRARKQ